MRRFEWLVIAALVGVVVGAAAAAEIPGDADFDGDLDFADFAHLANCVAGPEFPASAACEASDADFDGDVDLADAAALQRCFSGASQPADPACAVPLARIEDGCLLLFGTSGDTILALRLVAGAPNALLVDYGNDGTTEFAFERGAFTCIVIDTGGGDDVIVIDESNGVFTDAELTTVYGGEGHDTFHGGSGPEVYVGGSGDDTAQLNGGDDRFVWEPEDGTDLVEGGPGADTVEVNGADSDESFTVTANGTRVRFDRIAPAPFFLDLGGCEHLVLQANGGNDSLACTGNLAALIQVTAEGGAGDDTLLGSNGADVLNGGDDDDFVDGQQGNDALFGGVGDDVFQWDPGDGSDTVEGQAGVDTLVFNGSNAAENLVFTANGARVRLTRDIGNIVMDVDALEQVDLRALGGADNVTVNDLTGTDLVEVNVALASTLGGGSGDAQADTVTVNGTQAPDTIDIVASGGAVEVIGLSATTRITQSEVANDTLVVNGLGGVDAVAVDPGVTSLIQLIVNQ